MPNCFCRSVDLPLNAGFFFYSPKTLNELFNALNNKRLYNNDIMKLLVAKTGTLNSNTEEAKGQIELHSMGQMRLISELQCHWKTNHKKAITKFLIYGRKYSWQCVANYFRIFHLVNTLCTLYMSVWTVSVLTKMLICSLISTSPQIPLLQVLSHQQLPFTSKVMFMNQKICHR